MPTIRLSGRAHWFASESLEAMKLRKPRYFSANVIFPDDDSMWSGAFFVEPEVDLGVFESDTVSMHFMPNVAIDDRLKVNDWFYISKGPSKIGKFEITDIEHCPDDWKPVGIS